MTHFRGNKSAFGAPGLQPRWTHADKEGIGTAHSVVSRLWITIRQGILTEVYYPTVDRPQTGDVQFLFGDENELFLEEKRDLDHQIDGYCRRNATKSLPVTAKSGSLSQEKSFRTLSVLALSFIRRLKEINNSLTPSEHMYFAFYI